MFIYFYSIIKDKCFSLYYQFKSNLFNCFNNKLNKNKVVYSDMINYYYYLNLKMKEAECFKIISIKNLVFNLLAHFYSNHYY